MDFQMFLKMQHIHLMRNKWFAKGEKIQEAESWKGVLNPIGLFWLHLQVPDENVQNSPSQNLRLPVDCVAELPGT